MKQAALDFDGPELERDARGVPVRLSWHVRGGAPTVQEAQAGEARARGQEARVLAFLRQRGGRWTPPEIAAELGIYCGSVRRSLTNLKGRGLAIKIRADRRPGDWGVSNCTWEEAKQ